METTPEAARFLEATEARLVSVLSHGSGDVGQSDTLLNAGRHLCIGSGGKRVRPTMVHLFGLAAGAPEVGLLNVAVAAELVHSASLLHDDVVDAGMYRRGRPTVNALWGNVVAVMGGDLLLTLALDELAGLDREVTFAAVRTVAEMTRATIGEVEARGDLSLPADRFRSIMEGKTGALFGFCGAAAAGSRARPEAARRFETFGRHLGVAFQIADDLKDLQRRRPGQAGVRRLQVPHPVAAHPARRADGRAAPPQDQGPLGLRHRWRTSGCASSAPRCSPPTHRAPR